MNNLLYLSNDDLANAMAWVDNRLGNTGTDYKHHDFYLTHLKALLEEQHRRATERVVPTASANDSLGSLNPQPLNLTEQHDHYFDVADYLTKAIAKYFGQNFGEHTRGNNPWLNAIKYIEKRSRY